MAISSVLRVHPKNPRYFTDDTGRAIYLTGSHTWANLQDIGAPGTPPFPYGEYLDFLSAHHHNFMRLWMFEQARGASWTPGTVLFDPLPWKRTGPGAAADGLPRFDLDAWNQEYFLRLRDRVSQAKERGIYCAVMLFQGWSLHKLKTGYGDPWPYHPFNGKNNINGVDAEYGGADDDDTPCLHSLRNAKVMEKQTAYVRKVIETVNGLDNVLYEIINEGGSVDWHNHMVDLVHRIEGAFPKQHPVGMTQRGIPMMSNDELFRSRAEWISPANEPVPWIKPGTASLQDYAEDPPVCDGRKIIISDTDHIWGYGGNAAWVWKTFCRGQHPIFMDPWRPLDPEASPTSPQANYVGGLNRDDPDYPDWEPLRIALGETRRFAESMDLAAMEPHPELASSGYCLADPGREYLVYLPEGGKAIIDLRGAPNGTTFELSWYFPRLALHRASSVPIPGGDYTALQTPFTGDAVFRLKRTGKHDA